MGTPAPAREPMVYYGPAPVLAVMREQFDLLLEHAAQCGLAGCEECGVVLRIGSELLAAFRD